MVKLLVAAGIYLLLHNLSLYPTDLGYNFGFHATYAEILTFQWRLPDLTETAVAYNPPLFYFISGLFARFISGLTGKSFLEALKFWPYVNAGLALVGLGLWNKIIARLWPRDKWLGLVSVIWVFSTPVWQTMMPMYLIEPFLLFTVALVFYYFVLIFQPQPTVKKTLILAILTSVNILSRLTALILPPIIMLGILGLGLLKQISWRKTVALLVIFLSVTLMTSGWFYYARRDQKIVYMANVPQEKRPTSIYGPAFYTNIPFQLMMTYPLRLPPPNPTYLIPVYYSSFWGDYWNYYLPRRFNISAAALKNDRGIVNDQRLQSLAWQNRINLLPTVILIAGFIYQFWLIVKPLIKKTIDQRWLAATMFFGLSVLSWLGFLYFITFHPSWKGDGIKACYMLFNLPIFFYMATIFLFKKLVKYKLVFIPTLLWLVVATAVNLGWSWY